MAATFVEQGEFVYRMVLFSKSQFISPDFELFQYSISSQKVNNNNDNDDNDNNETTEV